MLISIQAFSERSDETRWDRHIAYTQGGIFDSVVPIDDRLTALHLILDVSERSATIHHLIENTSQTPDIARLAEFHEFGLVGDAASCIGLGTGVHERFGGHIIWGADLGLAMYVHGFVGLDGISDAEVDELEAALDEHEVVRFEV